MIIIVEAQPWQIDYLGAFHYLTPTLLIFNLRLGAAASFKVYEMVGAERVKLGYFLDVSTKIVNPDLTQSAGPVVVSYSSTAAVL